MNIEPVAYIRTDFPDKFGIPRQSGRVPALKGRIVFFPEYRKSEALRGIEGFSHLWLIFDFSRSHTERWSPTVRPPRLGGNKRIGVFASRSPFRPNALGLSSVRLTAVEHTDSEGDVLIVSGADLMDMTPIYDIKPYLPFTDCHIDAEGGYAEDFVGHRLEVRFADGVRGLIPEELLEGIVGCLSDDPRPSYHDDSRRIYSMRYADLDVHFTVENEIVTVTGIDCIQ